MQVFLKLTHAEKSPGDLLKMKKNLIPQFWETTTSCVSNKLPGEAYNAGPQTLL
jgi:hypothetical protein